MQIVGSPEFPQKSRLETTILGVNEVGQLGSARPCLTPIGKNNCLFCFWQFCLIQFNGIFRDWS